MADRIQIRRDTAANWTSANPVLSDGEMGLERDTRKFKFGDGVTAWNLLVYAAGTSGDLSYAHTQSVADVTWTVTHNLGKYPSVTVVDTAGDEVEGNVNHISVNQLTITFSAAFSGKAYVN